MISLKSNGDGTTTILAYMNDTLLVNATGGALTASTAKAWPFQSQLGAAKDNGLSVWSLFGTKAANPIFDKVDVYSTITTPGVGGDASHAGKLGCCVARQDRVHPRPAGPVKLSH